MMFAFVTPATSRRWLARAYSNAKRMIRSDASTLIGLTEIPEPAAICFGWSPFSVSMTVFAFGLPASYSMPAYRSSVFSRTTTMSTFS